jgi:hypothetical protein
MPSTRTFAIACGASFAALLIIGWGGSALQASGMVHDAGALKIPMLIVMISLLAIFAVSAIPLMVSLVLGFQRTIGNENVPAIRSAIGSRNIIVYAIWCLMAPGALIAIPAAIYNGALGERSKQAIDAAMLPASQGMLVVRPGMTFAEMARQSSLRLDIDTRAPISSAVGGGGVFDFHIPGTGMYFRNCRYYFVSPYTHAPDRVEAVNVGLSPHPVSRTELEQANAALRRKLAADSWLTGHEEYRSEEDRTLHSGLSRGPDGRTWLRNDIVLDIESRRMDDAAPGEDQNTAGKWIQFIDIWPRADYPGIERLVFAPYPRGAERVR